MEPMTIISTAISLLAPFLEKSGEKFAEKIGEDVWLWIKNAFSKQEKQHKLPKLNDIDLQEKLEKILLERITIDEKFKKEFEQEIEKTQKAIKSNYQQYVSNEEAVQKQIIIQENHGNIQM